MSNKEALTLHPPTSIWHWLRPDPSSRYCQLLSILAETCQAQTNPHRDQLVGDGHSVTEVNSEFGFPHEGGNGNQIDLLLVEKETAVPPETGAAAVVERE